MKNIFLLILFILFTTTFAMAQSKESIPQAEIFTGGSYIWIENGHNLQGFNTSMTNNINKSWGITGDFGKYDFARSHVYTILAGPRYSMRLQNNRVIPFAHALFGAMSNDSTLFTMAYGGGLDIKINSAVAVRLFQADYLQVRTANHHTDNARLSFGIVLHLGSK